MQCSQMVLFFLTLVQIWRNWSGLAPKSPAGFSIVTSKDKIEIYIHIPMNEYVCTMMVCI